MRSRTNVAGGAWKSVAESAGLWSGRSETPVRTAAGGSAPSATQTEGWGACVAAETM
jgi:hypothetical protein